MSLLLLHPRVFDMMLDGDRFKSQWGGHTARKKPKPSCMSLKSEAEVRGKIQFWKLIYHTLGALSRALWAALWKHLSLTTQGCLRHWEYSSTVSVWKGFSSLQLVLRENCLVLPVSTTTLAHYPCLLRSDSHNPPSTAHVLSGSCLPLLYLGWIFQLSLKFVVHKISERENQVI